MTIYAAGTVFTCTGSNSMNTPVITFGFEIMALLAGFLCVAHIEPADCVRIPTVTMTGAACRSICYASFKGKSVKTNVISGGSFSMAVFAFHFPVNGKMGNVFIIGGLIVAVIT